VEALGVIATIAQTLTVTVLADETYACQVEPAPGYVTGVATTAIAVVAPVIETVVEEHAPAKRALPPMLLLVPASGWARPVTQPTPVPLV